jgi:hypothetical protein
MAKTKKGIPVDFTGSNNSGGGGGGSWRVPEGDYLFKITKVETGTSGAGNAKIVVIMKGVEGKVKGRTLYSHLALTTKALWKVRQLLEALGMEVPSGKGRLDIEGMVGKTVGVTLGDGDPYEGKIKSEAKLFIDPEAVGEEPDEEDEDEEDDEDEEEDDALEDLDRDELKLLLKQLKLDKAKKNESDDDLRARIRAAQDDDDEIEDIDLDEEM